MPEDSSKRPNSEVEGKVNIADEMHQSIWQLAGGRGEHDTRETMLARAARRAGISQRQARALYYREAKDPKSSVVERVRDAISKSQIKAEQDARKLASKSGDVDQLVARAVEVDADFRREIAALVLSKFPWLGSADRSVAGK